MRSNEQSADNILDAKLYELAIQHIKDEQEVLNLGCGGYLNFEKQLIRKRDVNIKCCDINPMKVPNESEHIKFFEQNVEKRFNLDSKVDVVTFFEVIEHIDETDILLQNCYNNLKGDGLLICSLPNLASIYARIELLLGFQPHVLEVSNVYGNFGAGIFGKLNNPMNVSIHHIRGFTHRAIKEMLSYYGFSIIKIYGYDHRLKRLMKYFPSFASVNVIVARKSNRTFTKNSG
ncbi:MAG: methyltransferase domain-containing protein [Thiomargarita sp.]|nr:methyltransferase domain-containing protein [Thiomargarita sp.]